MRFQIPGRARLRRGVALGIPLEKLEGKAANYFIRAATDVGLAEPARADSANVCSLRQQRSLGSVACSGHGSDDAGGRRPVDEHIEGRRRRGVREGRNGQGCKQRQEQAAGHGHGHRGPQRSRTLLHSLGPRSLSVFRTWTSSSGRSFSVRASVPVSGMREPCTSADRCAALAARRDHTAPRPSRAPLHQSVNRLRNLTRS